MATPNRSGSAAPAPRPQEGVAQTLSQKLSAQSGRMLDVAALCASLEAMCFMRSNAVQVYEGFDAYMTQVAVIARDLAFSTVVAVDEIEMEARRG